jgi:hypothetical protein
MPLEIHHVAPPLATHVREVSAKGRSGSAGSKSPAKPAAPVPPRVPAGHPTGAGGQFTSPKSMPKNIGHPYRGGR